MTEKINPGASEGVKLSRPTRKPLLPGMIEQMAEEIAQQNWLGWGETPPTPENIARVKGYLKQRQSGKQAGLGSEIDGAAGPK